MATGQPDLDNFTLCYRINMPRLRGELTFTYSVATAEEDNFLDASNVTD